MYIKGYRLNNDLILELGKFTVLWNCFERDFCCNNCNPRVINDLDNKIIINLEDLKELHRVINVRRVFFIESVKEYAEYSLHPDGARVSNNENINLMMDFIDFKGNKLEVGALLCINRIRNNMLHGLKQLSSLNNQIGLFRAVNRVLENVTEKTPI